MATDDRMKGTPDGPSKSDNARDHGLVVQAPRIHRIWAWIFPAIAAAAGLGLLWSNWKSQGPEISIRFPEAPGIQSGKTVLIYRGVTSGHVTGVSLDPDLDGVVVRVRLKAFAESLARKNTSFWIDQPVISIRETSGLDSIIQGNSIQARIGDGPTTTSFQGLSKAPIEPLDAPSLVIRLRAPEIPYLASGTPVYHRGVQVGLVRDKALDEEGKPYLRVMIKAEFPEAVRTTSRFWMLPAASVTAGMEGVTLNLPGLEALIYGGIAFDDRIPGGDVAQDGMDFHLAPTELAARMDGPEIELTFDDARGLVEGGTTLNLSGYPVGLIERVWIDSDSGIVRAKARLGSEFAGIAKQGSALTLVRPRVSLDGVTGLDTLLTGVYVDWVPGTGTPESTFAVRSVGLEAWERDGLQIVVTPEKLSGVAVGTMVYHRGVAAGRVTEKFRDSSGGLALRVVIKREFEGVLNARSRFWYVPALSATAGPGVLDLQVASIETLLRGRLAFDDFSAEKGKPAAVKTGAKFPLFASEAGARAVSPAIRILLPRGQGLLAGKTQLRRLGVPVGLVESVRPLENQVEVIARFDAGYDDLRRKGAEFAIVQPQISLQGMTGIETLVSGVYIECVPGSGAFLEAFAGRVEAEPELLEEESSGFVVKVVAPETTIAPGAPVTFRDVAVGRVVEKNLSDDDENVILTLSIETTHRHLVRENTVFWDSGGVSANVGFVKVRIPGQSLVTPNGEIAFGTPGDPGPPARAGREFSLGKRPVRLK